jgi:hypothetical protein
MKTISNFWPLLLALVFPVLVHGEAPPAGFVRLVHAVAAGEGNLKVKLDGADLLARGYTLGQSTGGIGLPEGPHALEFARAGVGPLKETIQVAKGETITVLAYAEKAPAKREGQQPNWKIKLRKLRAVPPDREYRLHLISLCERDEVVVQTFIEANRKTETTPLKRLKAADVDLGRSRGGVELRWNGEPLATVSLDDPGRYVVVIYEDLSGRIKALTFYDPKFEVAG